MNKDCNILTLDVVSGYASEDVAWQVLYDISKELSGLHSKGVSYGNVCLSAIVIDDVNNIFCLSPASASQCKLDQASDIWGLGASVFELLMGVPVFGGRGENEQTETMPVPTFRKGLYDEALGRIVAACLSFNPNDRPDAAAIALDSAKGLENCKIISKGRKPRTESYEKSNDVLKYWPEKMI